MDASTISFFRHCIHRGFWFALIFALLRIGHEIIVFESLRTNDAGASQSKREDVAAFLDTQHANYALRVSMAFGEAWKQ
jgi:hypothetical protein